MDVEALATFVTSAEGKIGTEIAEEMIGEDSDEWPLELPALWLVVPDEVADKDTFTTAIAVANGVSYSWIDDFVARGKT